MPGRTKKHRHPKKNETGSFRIIAGQWRSRRLTFPAIEGLRPTTDRVRETLFNWLANYLREATVLDLFAGSGALGFEALSRGAAKVTLVEQNAVAAKALHGNLQLLQGQAETVTAEIVHDNALNWLPKQALSSFDVIFLDPPFRTGLLDQTLVLLDAKLKAGTLIYLEVEQERSDLPVPGGWQLLKDKVAGQVNYRLYQI